MNPLRCLFTTLTLSTFLIALQTGVCAEEDAPASSRAAATKIEKSECSNDSSAPWLAFGDLLKGNQQFMSGKVSPPLDLPAKRMQLMDGQKPKAIILSCSDSRVPPELIFNQGLGDLFVVRSAGEVPDRAGIASIEYAVEHLGAHLIVVLGHESCGAVKAAITTGPDKSAGSPDLDYLISQIRPDLGSMAGGSDKFLKEPVKSHAQGVARRLIEQSKILKDEVEKQDVLIVSGVYQLGNGKVDFTF